MKLVATLIAVMLIAQADGSSRKLALAKDSSPQANELEQSSRQAIIETGFSEAYFDKHFRVVAAFDRPGDTRVVWKFSVNGYETTISDAIGYYTDNQRRVFVHSVKNTLGATRDISRTISRRRARALMSSCVGRYTGEAVALMRLSPGERMSLFLTAHSISRRRRSARSDAERINGRAPENDVPEREKTNRPMSLGYINIETGKCSRGRAIATP
jgi:hypothetical protein